MAQNVKHQEFKALLGTIQENLNNSETLKGVKLVGIHLAADGEGTHLCCCNGISTQVPDSMSCADYGCGEGGCPDN